MNMAQMKTARLNASPSVQKLECLVICRSVASGIRRWNNINPAAAFIESDLAVNQREQRPIATCSHVAARDKLCAALPHNDASGPNELATESLDSEALAYAIASVTNTSLTFLVCHKVSTS
jgi:hypothetical protein